MITNESKLARQQKWIAVSGAFQDLIKEDLIKRGEPLPEKALQKFKKNVIAIENPNISVSEKQDMIRECMEMFVDKTDIESVVGGFIQ